VIVLPKELCSQSKFIFPPFRERLGLKGGEIMAKKDRKRAKHAREQAFEVAPELTPNAAREEGMQISGQRANKQKNK
jgi:hypothetical protein